MPIAPPDRLAVRVPQRTAVRWRFAAWVACVLVVALVPPLWALAGDPGRRGRVGDAAAAALWAADVALLLLLLTTPRDAIRLRAGRSVAWVGGLTAWTYGVAAVSIGGTPDAWTRAGWLTVLATLAAWVLARRAISPWWAGVWVWTPLALAPYQLSFMDPMLAGALLTFVVVIAPRSGTRLDTRR